MACGAGAGARTTGLAAFCAWAGFLVGEFLFLGRKLFDLDGPPKFFEPVEVFYWNSLESTALI